MTKGKKMTFKRVVIEGIQREVKHVTRNPHWKKIYSDKYVEVFLDPAYNEWYVWFVKQGSATCLKIDERTARNLVLIGDLVLHCLKGRQRYQKRRVYRRIKKGATRKINLNLAVIFPPPGGKKKAKAQRRMEKLQAGESKP